jgi:hypothetical protein
MLNSALALRNQQVIKRQRPFAMTRGKAALPPEGVSVDEKNCRSVNYGKKQQGSAVLPIHWSRCEWMRCLSLCHPDRSVPGFPATQHQTRTRVRPSVKKGA